jgi:predicted Holliday junction resolvase-like endonuclease
MTNISNILFVPFVLFLGIVIGFVIAIVSRLGKERDSKIRSLRMQRSVLGGRFSEQVAPYLPGFPIDLRPSEAKFLGDPVDFIIFNGLDDKNITEVVFVEIKTGRSRYNNNEKTLKNAIDNKRVRYVTYNVPEEISRYSPVEKSTII